MATTCKLIGKVTLGSNSSSIEFTSIPGTYTDLIVVASLRGDQAGGNVYHGTVLQFNSSTSNYSSRELGSSGSGVSSTSRNVVGNGMYVGNANGDSATASTFSSLEIYIPNYGGAANKSVSVTQASENNGTEAYLTALAGLWADTAAITSVKLLPFSGHGNNFLTHSSAYLYGITKA
jgi:hypothetical protein